MKINSNTKIENLSVILVPYQKCHVQKYHEWMKSKELQDLTASSPLSLKEEYEMQESWLNDSDKCTFIILDSQIYSKNNDEIEAMIGDTNLFFINEDATVAEIEIMIAEPVHRGQQRGWNSILSMLRYGVEVLHIKKIVAKVGINNKNSISLFSKLKFDEESISEVFQEVTLIKIVTNDWISWLFAETLNYQIMQYQQNYS